MRFLKVTLLATVSTLAVLAAAVGLALAVADDEDYRQAAIFLLERLTGQNVEIRGTFQTTLSWEPSVSATDLRIANAPWATAPQLAEVGKVEIKIALKPLVSGVLLVRRLAIEDGTFELESDPNNKRNWRAAPDLEGDRGGGFFSAPPIFERADLRGISVRYRHGDSDETTQLEIRELSFSDRDQKGILTARGSLNERDFQADGVFGPLAQALKPSAPFPIDLALRFANLDLELEGTIEEPARGRGLDMKVMGRSDEVANIVELFNLGVPYAGRFRGEARIAGDILAPRLEDLHFVLDEGPKHRMDLSGSIDDIWALKGVALSLSEVITAEAEIFRILPEEMQLFETVSWETLLRDEGGRYLLDQVDARATSSLGAALEIQGRFRLAKLAIDLPASDIDILLNLTAPNTAAIARPLALGVPELGAVAVTAHVKGMAAGPEVESFTVKFGQGEPFDLTVAGRVAQVATTQPMPFTGLDAQLSLRAEKTAPMLSLWHLEPLEFGALEAKARLVDRDANHYGFDDVEIALGGADGLEIEASGRIAAVSAVSPDLIEGIELDVGLSAGSLTALSDLAGAELPDLGPLAGSLTVNGRSASLGISNIDVRAGTKDSLQITATGAVQAVEATREITAKGVDLAIEVMAPNTREAAALTDLPLPELGPVRGTAKLSGSDNGLGLENVALRLGEPDQAVVTVTGQLANIIEPGKRDIAGEFEVELARLVKPEHGKLAAELGRLKGVIGLSDKGGTFSIEEFRGETLDSEPLALKIEGVFDDLEQRDGLEFKTALKARSLEVLGGLFDASLPALGPFSFSGTLSGDDEDFRAQGHAHLGKSDLQLDITGSFSGDRPRATGSLSSLIFYPGDFGIRPDGDQGKADGKETKGSELSALFDSDPVTLDFLKGIDLSLQVLLNEVRGVDLSIDQADINLVLEGGRLQLRPVELTFYGGSLEAEVELDQRLDEPSFGIKATGDNVDIGAFLAQVQDVVPVEGKADMSIDLTASGNSPLAWASSLNGQVEFAVNRARVHSSVLDLPGRGLGVWLFGKSIKGYTEVDCFIAQMDIENGDAVTRALILDTPAVRSAGTGNIDLPDEELDILVDPKPKRRQLVDFTTPYRIHGDLRDPSITIDKTDLAAQKVGDLIFSPVNALGSLFSTVTNGGSDMDNPCLRQ